MHLYRLAEQEFVVSAGGGFGQVISYRVVVVAGDTPAPVLATGYAAASAPTPTLAHTPMPMTYSVGGVWGGFGGPATPNERADEISVERAHADRLGGLGVCTPAAGNVSESYVDGCHAVAG